jgi:hypothetical protein
MSNVKVVRLRQRAFSRQHGLCFYCLFPMWERTIAPLVDRLRVSTKAIKQLQCTAEHLFPVCCGGKDTAENIVAACWFCNQSRHRARRALSPNRYFIYVQRRLSKGRWHSLAIWEAIASLGGRRDPSQ